LNFFGHFLQSSIDLCAKATHFYYIKEHFYPKFSNFLKIAMSVADFSNRTRLRNFCWTINNPTQADRDLLFTLPSLCSYYVFGEEGKDEEKTTHLQGYCELPSQKLFSDIKKWFPRAHLEARRGSAKQASDYCKKGQQSHDEWKESGVDGPNYGSEALVSEWGQISNPGKRSDIKNFVDAVKEKPKTNMKDLIESHTGVVAKYPVFVEKVRNLYVKYDTLDWKTGDPPNLWYVGPSGAGKSRRARDEFPQLFSKMLNKWWDGYDNESTVLLDDLHPDHCKGLTSYLKVWSDRYVFTAEIKGASVKIRPERIIVTTQYSLAELFVHQEDRDAIKRRFKIIEIIPE